MDNSKGSSNKRANINNTGTIDNSKGSSNKRANINNTGTTAPVPAAPNVQVLFGTVMTAVGGRIGSFLRAQDAQNLRNASRTLSRNPQLALTPAQQRVLAAQKKANHLSRQVARTPVTIAYRDDSHGSGAFWDHYTMQRNTGRSTVASHHDAVQPLITAHDDNASGRGQNYRGKMPVGVPVALPASQGRGAGLLMIAGGNTGLESEQPERNSAHIPSAGSAAQRHALRQEHERTLLLFARLSGRPVLAVCGGSWRLLESFGGQTRQLPSNTHQSRQMPFLRQDGTVGGGNNVSSHGVAFEANTMLTGAMSGGKRQPLPSEVNSVHWSAADEHQPGELSGVVLTATASGRRLPALQVSARGITGTLHPYVGLNEEQRGARHQHSVEAFESRHGAPMMGLQWHPEAYNPGDPSHEANRRVLTYMARAGDAYNARRTMTNEFSAVHEQVAGQRLLLSPTAILAQVRKNRSGK